MHQHRLQFAGAPGSKEAVCAEPLAVLMGLWLPNGGDKLLGRGGGCGLSRNFLAALAPHSQTQAARPCPWELPEWLGGDGEQGRRRC